MDLQVIVKESDVKYLRELIPLKKTKSQTACLSSGRTTSKFKLFPTLNAVKIDINNPNR